MKITIIGCGNMGMTYARSFLKYNVVAKPDLLLVEKNEQRKEELVKLDLGEVVLPDDTKIRESELIILAVKPQDFNSVVPDLTKVLSAETTVLSIMAGIKLSYLERELQHKKIIRAMPNSPAELGIGITAFAINSGISSSLENIRKVENLLATTGRTVFLENEDLLDAVTALSGSGPAYFFYLVKAMVEAGKQMGMEEAVATLLVKQTMLGAYHLINNTGKSLDELIKIVASKGGTTEAAFTVFNETHLAENLQQAIFRAEKRAKELSEKVSQ